MASLALIERSISISLIDFNTGFAKRSGLSHMTLMPLYSESLHISWTINVPSDGPLRPLTLQTFLSLPNGQMHSVIFTSNSYNDKRAGC